MLLQTTLPWRDPIACARIVADYGESFAFLHTSLPTDDGEARSLLAFHPKTILTAENFDTLGNALTQDKPTYANAWFGYLGYPLRHALETLLKNAPHWYTSPPLFMAQYHSIFVFNHTQQTLECWSDAPDHPLYVACLTHDAPRATTALPAVTQLTSPMSKAEYISKVNSVKDAIARGDLSQANLTRKFNGSFTEAPRPIDIFMQLCTVSPVPYSALLNCNGTYIISSSPELFLNITPDGRITTRPIKGTIHRESGDDTNRAWLEKSEKNRAENLMIVDLMRNDLSRVAELGSVKVDKLFDVTSYATLHHMASTITAEKRQCISSLDVVKACFPAGSMTGTPKIKTMQLCSKLEQVERGIYSGALGWFGGDGSATLSVIIRTLILQGTEFEFQVGGGIVADSTPEEEWQETLTKATGITRALNIPLSHLAAL
jgi:para-aminobenzoate synthetase component I